MAKENVSAENSIKGYKVSIWAKGLLNFRKWIGSIKNSLKTLLVAFAGVAAFYFLPWATTQWGEALAVTVSAAVTKFLVDMIDFFLSKVELNQ